MQGLPTNPGLWVKACQRRPASAARSQMVRHWRNLVLTVWAKARVQWSWSWSCTVIKSIWTSHSSNLAFSLNTSRSVLQMHVYPQHYIWRTAAVAVSALDEDLSSHLPSDKMATMLTSRIPTSDVFTRTSRDVEPAFNSMTDVDVSCNVRTHIRCRWSPFFSAAYCRFHTFLTRSVHNQLHPLVTITYILTSLDLQKVSK